MSKISDRPRELGAFLRSRRERLDPADFDLPPRRQPRRTPGLRREEVAELARVSIDYIVRLEQGRGAHPSVDVVDALARALRLTPAERAYLGGLAHQRPRHIGASQPMVAPALARLVADLSPTPAMVLDGHYDIVAANPEVTALLLDVAEPGATPRNAMRMCLLDTRIREMHLDPERVIRDGIAHLRAAQAAHPQDAEIEALIAECIASNDDVDRLWTEPDVQISGRGSKRMRHPLAGILTVDFEVLIPLHEPDHRLVLFHPADAKSQTALNRLSEGSRTHPSSTRRTRSHS